MSILGAIEIAVSLVGTYNIVKGMYTIYRDADKIKDKYMRQQQIIESYKNINKEDYELTASQYHKFEDDFIILS